MGLERTAQQQSAVAHRSLIGKCTKILAETPEGERDDLDNPIVSIHDPRRWCL
jgi:hypothetical protein